MYRLLRPLIFALDAETAHRATIGALSLSPPLPPPAFPNSLMSKVAGIDFPSPVGLAAGFDKDAQVPAQMLGLGFGFVEVGTLTPRPQPGNPRPRQYRLVEDEAVINRLGFNNDGQAAALRRLSKPRAGIIGVNVGANKDSADFVADYVAGLTAMAPVADYLTVNISSPNTLGLRGLQDEGALKALLEAVRAAQMGKPVFLKVAPDLSPADPERIVRAAIDHGIAALIVSNTTITRPPLKSRFRDQAGGLSGRPLRGLALDMLRKFAKASGGEIPLIGVGGIGSADDAWDRIRAGASLVQLYTAMVYDGPRIASRIAQGLAEHLKREGFANIAEAVGTKRA